MTQTKLVVQVRECGAKTIYTVPVVDYDQYGRYVSGDIANGVRHASDLSIDVMNPNSHTNSLMITVNFRRNTPSLFKTKKRKMENIVATALQKALGRNTSVKFAY